MFRLLRIAIDGGRDLHRRQALPNQPTKSRILPDPDIFTFDNGPTQGEKYVLLVRNHKDADNLMSLHA